MTGATLAPLVLDAIARMTLDEATGCLLHLYSRRSMEGTAELRAALAQHCIALIRQQSGNTPRFTP